MVNNHGDRFRPLRVGLTLLVNGGDPITTEPSTWKPILQVVSVSSDPLTSMICCIFFGGMKYYPAIPRILLRG